MEEKGTEIMDSGDTADLVFLDFSETFDSVNHSFLTTGFRFMALMTKSWIGYTQFYKERTFNASSHGSIHPSKTAVSGLPHISSLTSDFPFNENKCDQISNGSDLARPLMPSHNDASINFLAPPKILNRDWHHISTIS